MAIKDSLLKVALQTQKKSVRYRNYRIERIEDLPNQQQTDEAVLELEQKNADASLLNDDKPTTNRQQTDDKPATELITNRQQTDNKPTTNWQHKKQDLIKSITNRQQTDNETDNRTDNKPITNWQQTDNKLATNNGFYSLTGLQRESIILIYQECKKSLSKTTDPLTLEYLSSVLRCTSGVVKVTLQRLEKKGCLIRKEFKNGRGGWSKYELPKDIYNEIILKETDNKLITNRQQTDNKLATKPATEPATNLSSSSSLNNINTTTTGQADLLPAEWEDLEMSEIYGLTKQKLLSVYPYIVQCGFSVFDIQQAIDAIVYDDKQGHKKIDNRCGLLISGIRKGDLYISDFYNKHLLEKAEAAKRKNQALLDAKVELWIQEVGKTYVESQLPSHLAIDFKVGGKDAKRAVEQLYFKSQTNRTT